MLVCVYVLLVRESMKEYTKTPKYRHLDHAVSVKVLYGPTDVREEVDHRSRLYRYTLQL